jgi:ribosome biogenesis GTPase
LKNGVITCGATREQVLAANIDTVFIVTGLDHDFNLQRIERYITLAWHSGAQPVLLLNKAGVCRDVGKYKALVEQNALGMTVIPLSMVTGLGLNWRHA